jgi:hypothetical protein
VPTKRAVSSTLRTRSRAAAFALLVLALALIDATTGARASGARASGAAAIAATDVCGASSNHSVDRLVIRIQFHADPNSTPALSEADLNRFAKAFAVQAEVLFNGHGYTVAGAPVQLEVDTTLRSADQSPSPDTHQIAVTASSDSRSGIVGVGTPGGAPLTGEFSLGYVGSNPEVGLHELGHLLGLHDQYQDVLKDASGTEAPLPPGITFNNNGSIQNKADYASYAAAHGLDFNTMKGVSVPNPGHQDDIMATTKDPNAVFQSDALKSILGYAHRCDPPPPKFRVPVFPGAGGRGCFTTKTFHPILDAPWPQIALPRYRRAFKPQLECTWRPELAAERALVEYALETASAAGDVRTAAGTTCDEGETTTLYKIFDQLYNNARNAASEVAHRALAVYSRVIFQRTGYAVGKAALHVIRLFGDDEKRVLTIDSLIGGSDNLGCTDGPASSSSSGPFD